MSHMQPTGQKVVKDKHGTGLNVTMGVVAWTIAVLSVGYMVPWAIAVSRGKTNSIAIFIVNLLLGWTLIGWIIALVMACSAHQTNVVTTY